MLAVALGSSGDVNPILGIARGLVRRGHEVIVLANDVFEDAVGGAGAGFESLGPAAQYEDWVRDPRSWSWPSCARKAFEDGWIPWLRPTYERIEALAKPGATAVLSGSIGLGAGIAREKLGLPFVAVHVSPLMLRSLDEVPLHGPWDFTRFLGRPGRRLFYGVSDLVIDRWLAPGVNAFRKSLGLRPIRGVFQGWVGAADRILGAWPSWYFPPQSSWPERTQLTGFMGYDRGEAGGSLEPAVAAALEGPAPVLVTCGSSISHAGDFLAAAASLPASVGRPVLFLADRGFSLPADVSPGLTVSTYVPYSRVLPRVSAIVHHGGIGTAAAALAAGIPQVIIPLAFDQFDNAHRFQKLGLARWLPRRRLSGSTLAREVAEVLGSPAVGEKCRGYSGKLDPEAAVNRACDAIEDVLP